MAGELLAGAALGTLCSELYEHLENLIKKSSKYNPLLEQIKATLESLKPLLDQIESRNEDLGLSTEEINSFKSKVTDGIKLLDDCSNDPRWYKKASRTKKLTDLDEALKTQLAILTAQGVRDGKETLVLLRKQAEQVVGWASRWEDTNNVVEQLMRAAEVSQKTIAAIAVGFWSLRIMFNFDSVMKELDEYNIFIDYTWFGSGIAIYVARLIVLVVLIILEIPKYAAFSRFFLVPTGFSFTLIVDTYKQGFSCLWLCKIFPLITIFILQLFCCLLYLTYQPCQC